MIIKLLKYLRGYVRIRLTGFSPERFLNLCSNHNILIWDLMSSGDSYEMYITIKGFRQLRPIVKKTKTKITIIERHGLPFFLYRNRKRKVFFFGIAVCAILIFLMSEFIWNISIEGNYSLTTDVVLEYLDESGIYHGQWKREIDCKEIAKMLREEFDDIIWVSAKIKGTRLMIEVQENTDTFVEEEAEYEPSDIVANKSGVITQIITRNGTPMVTVGDTIEEGDLLISGRLDIYNDNGEIGAYEYCVSDADIYIQTTYEYKDEFPAEYINKNYSGEDKTTYSLNIFQYALKLWSGDIGFELYDVVTEETQWKITENFYLPITFVKTTLKEYTQEQMTYTDEEAVALANENLSLFYKDLQEKGVQISENNVKIEKTGNNYVVSGTITVIEKTGKRVDTEILETPKEEQETE